MSRSRSPWEDNDDLVVPQPQRQHSLHASIMVETGEILLGRMEDHL